MTDLHNRYPGAQPFSDNEFSRRTFFGREQASLALTDQVLANRLVVVYAKSGLGKSSLLNAGVAPRLREASSLPLFVRINDVQRGPLTSIIEGIKQEAERQGVEYVPGDSSSLWALFKSAEFWRGDLLLMPVLVLDQFEELFTLHSPETREKFLAELGYLIRGVPPASTPEADSGVTASPPAMHVVLSLREDFLGILEEGADHIPQILDHRFRLTPLNCETAAQAITGPAQIDTPGLETKPFRLDPEFVSVILGYLAKNTAGARSSSGTYVEPFHLQLICQRIEKVVAYKQKLSNDEVVLTFKDFGGENALSQTLVNFYQDSVHSVPGKYLRPAVRRLCEEYLISPEGRRLSIEERELQRQLKLPHAALSQLVDARLLRTDRRSDSTYYELSHDALIEPVLASRRTRALVVGWVALLLGSVISVVAGLMILFFIFAMFVEKKLEFFHYLGFSLVVVALASLGSVSLLWARTGLRRKNRYRRHTSREFSQRLPTLLPLKDRVAGWTMVGSGSVILGIWGGLGIVVGIIFLLLIVSHGEYPGGWKSIWTEVHNHPFVETSWIVIELAGGIVFGWITLRQGLRKLWPHMARPRFDAAAVPGVDKPMSWLPAIIKLGVGALALVVAVKCTLMFRDCVQASDQIPHNWVPHHISSLCTTIHEDGWKGMGFEGGLFLFSPLVIAVVLLIDGLWEAWGRLRNRRIAQQS